MNQSKGLHSTGHVSEDGESAHASVRSEQRGAFRWVYGKDSGLQTHGGL